MAQVIKAGDINIKNLKFSDPRKVTGVNGMQSVYINYDGGMNSLYVQPPRVDLKWDPTYYADNDGNTNSVRVEFSLPGVGTDDQITPFHDKMKEFDELVINKAYENRATWFKNKKLTRDMIENVYNPMIKVSVDSETGEPNGKWPPSFKFKIKKQNSKFTCQVFDSSKNQLNVDNTEADDYVDIKTVLVKGATVNLILKCVSVWIINGKFGVTWQAEQIMVTQKPSISLSGCAFLKDDDDEVPSNDVVAEQVVDDSDDEDEDEEEDEEEQEEQEVDEEEPAPEPEPEPKKKKVVRRVKKSD